jgi:hypothetical protein
MSACANQGTQILMAYVNQVCSSFVDCVTTLDYAVLNDTLSCLYIKFRGNEEKLRDISLYHTGRCWKSFILRLLAPYEEGLYFICSSE